MLRRRPPHASDAVVGGAVWAVAGVVAGIAAHEHRWAIHLRASIARTGGVAVLDEWIHPWM